MKKIYVYGDWESLGKEILIGTLNADVHKNKEVFSFEYDSDWIKNNPYSFFDSVLQLFRGPQYAPAEKKLFGVFTDSCPDRWGRILIKRREAIEAKEENRAERTLLESDYLLGIQDLLRTGALRFKTDKDGCFLADNSQHTIPVWTSIRELEDAAFHFDAGDGSDEEIRRWVKILLEPGSSLGGARPKASVQDTNGSLWIAKFPSKYDENNTGAWEMVVHELASLCGLNVPAAKCERFSKNGSTFIVKRFDRTASNKRIHFVSAMTVLGKKDGDGADEGVSYLDLAEIIQQNSTQPKKDLEELWKRIVFSIAVTNTDDHLRNHGFLFNEKSFYLSPLYDVNPNSDGTGLSLNIDENNNSLDYDLVISTAPYFGIKKDEASKIVTSTKEIITQWKTIAQSFGLTRQNIADMEKCFRC